MVGMVGGVLVSGVYRCWSVVVLLMGRWMCRRWLLVMLLMGRRMMYSW